MGVELDVVRRAKRGDRHAFAELAASAGDRLYAVAQRILRDPDAAGDATQQTLVKIWRRLPKLRDPERFDGWSYRLIVNACYDELRRQRRPQGHLQLLESDGPMPDPTLTVADRDQLERGFARLTPEHRSVVILQYYLDYSLPEIAAVLDIPVGTVRSRLHYAKRLLRSALEADARQPMDRGRLA
jgi:RNA polymerase sigma-70 factor (ECF subfamily)